MRGGAPCNDALRHGRHSRAFRQRSRHAGATRMRLPLGWLRDYVDPPADADALATQLAMLGFPVESIERRPLLRNVVVGRIERVERHPNADRLQVCTVDVGA